MDISIETTVNASLAEVWSAWTTPDHIKKWNFASDDWHCPKARIDLQVGGTFSYRMEAKDRSAGFDFEGTFTSIQTSESIEYALADDRNVRVLFSETEQGIRVVETFEADDEFSAEYQKQGWQAILTNFKNYVESMDNQEAVHGEKTVER